MNQGPSFTQPFLESNALHFKLEESEVAWIPYGVQIVLFRDALADFANAPEVDQFASLLRIPFLSKRLAQEACPPVVNDLLK
eukprot:9789313-Alexandrium_andersonii.AAC.1